MGRPRDDDELLPAVLEESERLVLRHEDVLRRRTVIVSVLESLRRHLPDFTLSSVLAEILDWSATGRSCCARLLQKLDLATPTTPALDRLLPLPDG